MAVATLSDLFFHLRDAAAGRTDWLSLRTDHGRETVSTSDFTANVHALALALEEHGIAPGDRVAILSENRPEWAMVDFACHLIGAPTVPLFPSLTSEQIGFILRNSGSRLVFYSGAERQKELAKLRGTLTRAPETVALDVDAAEDGTSLTQWLGRGTARRSDVPLERFRGRVGEDDLASLIYTSGTTGDPKGVMLSHRNLVSNFLAVAELFDVGPRDLALSHLPLSHVFQRTVDHLCFYRGAAIHYVPRAEDVAAALVEARPTILTSVPRFYERAAARLQNEIDALSGPKGLLARWALGIGRRHAAERQSGFVGPLLALGRRFADLVALGRLRRQFGGRLRLLISGGAPLPHEVAELFAAIGLPVLEGYGLTETSPVLATNTPRLHRPGSVGRAVPQVEIKISEDGEILVRGPGVMQGYWENPSATRDAVDEDGWLRTGDVGDVDTSGYLFITDRKKDLIVTADGKNIAPQAIEKRLVSHRLISQAVVVGDGRPYPAVLVVPDFVALAVEIGHPDLAPEELVSDPTAKKHIAEALAELNVGLAEHERPRRFRLLDRELSVEAGELTPTYKVRRRVIRQRYAEQIAALYAKDVRGRKNASSGRQERSDA